MKKKFLRNGLDVFEPHEALELYLYYAVPRRDTNPLAHRLLERYGTIGGVCDAPTEELINDLKLSSNTAAFLKMLPQMSKLYVESKMGDGNIIEPDDLGEIFRTEFVGQPDRAFALVLGDAKGKMIYCGAIPDKSTKFCETLLRKIMDLSLRHHAKYVFIAHNRIYGGSAQSAECDLKAVKTAKDALENVGVSLVDCYMVFRDRCVSVCRSSLLCNEVF